MNDEQNNASQDQTANAVGLSDWLGAKVSVKKKTLPPCTGIVDQIDTYHVHVVPDDGKFTGFRGGWYHPDALKIERP